MPRGSDEDELDEVLSDKGKVCPTCGLKPDYWAKFCMKCGIENPHFTLDALKKYGFNSLEEAREEECHDWHTDATMLDDEMKLEFCPLCGTNILNQVLGSVQGGAE